MRYKKVIGTYIKIYINLLKKKDIILQLNIMMMYRVSSENCSSSDYSMIITSLYVYFIVLANVQTVSKIKCWSIFDCHFVNCRNDLPPNPLHKHRSIVTTQGKQNGLPS